MESHEGLLPTTPSQGKALSPVKCLRLRVVRRQSERPLQRAPSLANPLSNPLYLKHSRGCSQQACALQLNTHAGPPTSPPHFLLGRQAHWPGDSTSVQASTPLAVSPVRALTPHQKG